MSDEVVHRQQHIRTFVRWVAAALVALQRQTHRTSGQHGAGAEMKPYYEHDGITIYNGDARELLSAVGVVESIITDPVWPNSVSAQIAREMTRT